MRFDRPKFPTIGQWYAHHKKPIPTWEALIEFPEKKCRTCGIELTGRKTAYCGFHCRNQFAVRFFVDCTWIKRVMFESKGVAACAGCGQVFESAIMPDGPTLPDPGPLEIDHILPLVDGGTHDLDNLQFLCKSCHRSKTARENKDRLHQRRKQNNPSLLETQ